MQTHRWLVPALSITLLVSYGSLYYAFAVLARPIQAEFGWTADVTVGAYSIGLLVAGLSAYAIGNVIDKSGGRRMMTVGSLLAGVCLVALSQVHSPYVYYLIWVVLGIAMALTQYEAAFAVIVGAFPRAYRNRIGVLTLAGGLASTIFWPLTHMLIENIGWRHAVIVLGMAHLVISVPLYWFTVPGSAPPRHLPADVSPELPHHLTVSLRRIIRKPVFWLAACCFTAFGFAINAMMLNVIPILESRHLSAAAAVSLAALVGPMQISARFADVLLNERMPVLVLGGITMLLIPLGIGMLLPTSGFAPLLYAFVVFYGAGLGLITITRATTIAELFGRQRYGAISGLFTAPSAVARALGPFIAATVLTAYHNYTVVLTMIVTVAGGGAIAYGLAAYLHRRDH